MNIYQRINAVRKAIGYVKKDAHVRSGGGYRAVTHDQVTAVLRGALVEHGVVVLPSLVSSSMAKTDAVTAKGTAWWRYEGTYEVSLVNVDDPADKTSIMVEAHALDTDDKAPGKALSYATKYALLKMFSLETGEDDESRVSDRMEPANDGPSPQFLELSKCADRAAFLQAWQHMKPKDRSRVSGEEMEELKAKYAEAAA